MKILTSSHSILLYGIYHKIFVLRSAFVPEVSKWVKVWSKVINAAPTYLTMPLIVLTSHSMQLSTIKVNDYHKEPTVLYGLVSGKSGTSKGLLCLESSIAAV